MDYGYYGFKIHNPWIWKGLTKSIIHMDLKSIKKIHGLGIFYGYGFKILKKMDFGMDMDLVSNPSGPTELVA